MRWFHSGPTFLPSTADVRPREPPYKRRANNQRKNRYGRVAKTGDVSFVGKKTPHCNATPPVRRPAGARAREIALRCRVAELLVGFRVGGIPIDTLPESSHFFQVFKGFASPLLNMAIYRFEKGRIAEDWGIATRALWL